jgi:shikimate dehydrogenase
VIIGAGGTAQAAVAALAELGCDPVTVAVRDLTRAEEVSRTAARLNLKIQVCSWEMLPELVASADLVISTVPVQASESLTGLPWRPGGFLLDVLYHPWPTPAAAAAQRLGCTVVPGSALLLHQAAHQVERMTGQAAPVAHMREALAACFSE